MQVLARIALAVLVMTGATAHGADPKEQLATDHLDVMKRFIEVLGEIKDVESAKKHKAELRSLADKKDALTAKADGLSIDHAAMVEYMKANHKGRSASCFAGIFGAMGKMSKLPEFDAIGDVIKEEVNSLSNQHWCPITLN